MGFIIADRKAGDFLQETWHLGRVGPLMVMFFFTSSYAIRSFFGLPLIDRCGDNKSKGCFSPKNDVRRFSYFQSLFQQSATHSFPHFPATKTQISSRPISTTDLRQMVVIVREIPLFQGNLGW